MAEMYDGSWWQISASQFKPVLVNLHQSRHLGQSDNHLPLCPSGFKSVKILVGICYYHLHFTDENSEALRGFCWGFEACK